jgi:hypothetical protein
MEHLHGPFMGKRREVYPRVLHDYARLRMTKWKIIPHLTSKARYVDVFSNSGFYKRSVIRELFGSWGTKEGQEAVNGRFCDNAQNTSVNHK